MFGIGALMFSCLLYASRLVPRWISVWGLVGAVPYAAVGVLGLFGVNPEVLYIPLAVQEMVLAVWLIAKGFDRGTIGSAGDVQTRAEWKVADARA